MRKRSMGTPAEVLQAFWQELRRRTRVIIDHSDLPDALKDIVAGAVQTNWQAANEAATGQPVTLRDEARHAASLPRQNATPRGPRPRRPGRNWPLSRRSWPRHATRTTPCRRTSLGAPGARGDPGAAGSEGGGAGGCRAAAGGTAYPILDRARARPRAGDHRAGTSPGQRTPRIGPATQR
ncbi:KfrA protein (fragment) [Cupriavidus taiwanensis]|uniref:KfrA protein n=1 Tax=Cupriavidus taiwanensis TaxID=164546 RepID=A0A375JB99_9BURK